MLDRLRRLIRGEKAQTSSETWARASIPEWARLTDGRKAKATAGTLVRSFHGWVYAAAMMNARQIACTPLRLYRVIPEGRTGTRAVPMARRKYLAGGFDRLPSKSVLTIAQGANIEEVTDHPILDLLLRVNPVLNGYDFAVLRKVYLQLTGDEFVHVVVDRGGLPMELWPMPSQWVAPVADRMVGTFASYTYGRGSENEVSLQPDEVLHNRTIDPANPWRGRGWVESAWAAVQMLGQMDEYEAAVFENHARPDWGVFFEENLTDPQWNRLLRHIDDNLRGTRNAGRPYIFEGARDAKPMQWSPRDLAYTEGESRLVERIAAISGVPVSKLKANDPNKASAEMGDYGWLSGTIHPMIVADEEFLNQRLVPMFGDDALFLAYDNPVPKDEQREVARLTAYVGAGIITPNEARADLGYEPVEGGDDLRGAARMMPSGGGDTEPEEPDDEPTDATESDQDEGGGEGDSGDDSGTRGRRSLDRDAVARRGGDGRPLHPVQVFDWQSGDCGCVAGECGCGDGHGAKPARGVKADAGDSIRDQVEARIAEEFAAALEPVLRSQQAALLGAITAQLTESVIEQAIERMAEAGGAMRGVGARFFAEAFTAGGQVEASTLGIGFGVVSDAVLEAANRSVDFWALSVGNTTADIVRGVLNDLLPEGASPSRIAAEIRARDDLFSKSRAMTIARTESGHAYLEGRIEAAKASGLRVRKRFVLAPNACPICEAFAAQYGERTWDIAEPMLKVGEVIEAADGSSMKVGYRDITAGQVHPNCRCQFITIVEGGASGG